MSSRAAAQAEDDNQSLSSLGSEDHDEILAEVNDFKRSESLRSLRKSSRTAGDDDASEASTPVEKTPEELEAEKKAAFLKVKAAQERLDAEREAGEELIEAAKADDLGLCKEILAYGEEEGFSLVNFRVPAFPAYDPAIRWTDFSPLMAAARSGSESVVRFFASEHQAEIEYFDRDRKMTALLWAAEGNHAEVIRVLKEYSDHNYRDLQGRTALLIAAAKGHAEATEQLLWSCDVNATDKSGYNSLAYACINGALGVARKLCDFDADVQQQNLERRTPLIHAARWGYHKIVKMLLDRGADPDHRDKYGWTALMMAARWNKLECARALLEHGADPAPTERSSGRNALMFASIHSRNTKLVGAILMKHKLFFIGAKDVYGKTALDLAVGGEVEIVIKDAFDNPALISDEESYDSGDSDSDEASDSDSASDSDE